MPHLSVYLYVYIYFTKFSRLYFVGCVLNVFLVSFQLLCTLTLPVGNLVVRFVTENHEVSRILFKLSAKLLEECYASLKFPKKS